jgi:hypothetical protein
MFAPYITETEFVINQAAYLDGETSAEVRGGVCYALSYMWIRRGLQPGGHVNMHLQAGLQAKFLNSRDESVLDRGSPNRFLYDVGGSVNGFGNPIFSLQRSICAQREVLYGTSSLPSGLKTICKRDHLTERLIANGTKLNEFEPFSTFIKHLRENRGSLKEGFCLILFANKASGHAISVQVASNGHWRLFDCNYGSYVFSSYDRFKVMFNELGLSYLAEGVAGGSWKMSTFYPV